MMDKKEALVRDLAKLFVKYDLEDWRLIIDALEKGGPEYEAIAQKIRDLSTKKRSVKPRTDRKHAERMFTELAKSNPKRAEILKRLYEQFCNTKPGPSLAHLREFCLKIGTKETIPKRRDDAVLFLLKLLAAMPDETFDSALREMPVGDRNLQDEYNKWFRMIYAS